MQTKPKDDESKIALLHTVPILSGLEDKALESLLNEADEESFPADSVIVKDGSFLADLYIILRGKVEVRKKNIVIARLGKGQFFGEMAFLNDSPTGRSADIVAVDETSCLKINGPVWYAFLRRHPDVAIEVIRVLADRLRNTNWALRELQNLPLAIPQK